MKHITQNKPACTDTAVVLCFFNPTPSIRIQQNILYVVNQLKNAGIPTFVGELCFNDELPLFQESETTFHFRSTSYMFFKENILNQMLSKPALQEFLKQVILDADVIFEDKDWLDHVSGALENQDIIQPYEIALRLQKNFVVEDAKPSICKDNLAGHTGQAWAFRKDWQQRIGGLFEQALTGGGDSVLAQMAGVLPNINPLQKAELKVWDRLTKVSYLPGNLYHLPHGSFINRQYDTRSQKLEETLKRLGGGKLADTVERNECGVFEWKPKQKFSMNGLLLQYFKNRDDDNF